MLISTLLLSRPFSRRADVHNFTDPENNVKCLQDDIDFLGDHWLERP